MEDDTKVVVDEVVVKTHFDLQQAVSDIKFWWNLHQHQNLSMTVVFLGSPKVKGEPPKMNRDFIKSIRRTKTPEGVDDVRQV